MMRWGKGSSSQEWLRLESITDGLAVINENGRKRYIKILEVAPTNFHLITPKEQIKLIDAFYSWILQSPQSFQINITTMKRDITPMLNVIQTKNIGRSKEMLEAKNDYLQLVEKINSEKTIRKQFLLIIEYERGNDGIRSRDIEVIAEQMWEEVWDIKEYFRLQETEVVDHENGENYFIGEVLYRYLNRKTSRALAFQERVNLIHEDASIIQGTESPKIDDASYVASNGLDTKDPRYIISDGVYQTFLYLRQDGYRRNVSGAWIDNLSNFGENVDVSLHFVKKNSDQVKIGLKQAQKGYGIKRSKAEKDGDQDKYDEASAEVSNSSFIRNRIKQGEELFDTVVLFTIMGDNIKELIDTRSTISRKLKSLGFYTAGCYARNEEAFRMSLPLNYHDRTIMSQGRRNFLTSSIASTFPFTAFEVFDETGELWGVNSYNRTAVAINLFNTEKLINANMAILGSPGVGKTFTEQVLGGRMCLNGKKIIFILPLKGHEHRRRCNKIGGSFISLLPGGKHCVNLFEIRPSKSLNEELIEGELVSRNLLTSKITQIKTFIYLLLGDRQLEPWEDDGLDVHLMKMYEEFGITADDSSIFDLNGKLRVMPTFSDFKDRIKDDENMDKIARMIYKFTDGSCKNMDGQTNVDFSNDYIVFDVDLDKIPKNLQAPFLYIAIDAGYSVLKDSRTEETVLFLDEIWKIMVNRFAAEFVIEMMKIVRGYGGSCIPATQDIEDLFRSGDMGLEILNCSNTKLLLSTKEGSVEKLRKLIGLNRIECKAIPKFPKGRGLLIMNNARITIDIESSEKELREITTDPNLLKKFAEEEKVKREYEENTKASMKGA